MIGLMRGRTRSTTPDLFSSVQESPSAPASERTAPTAKTESPSAASSHRHVLPGDLPNALKNLEDQEFDRLLSAMLAEQKRRGRTLPTSDKISQKRHSETTAPPMTAGRLNAIRAAFRAGITPSRIARQFGLPQSEVRKALASDKAK